MRKCLEPDPLQRYPSAAALAEDLWRFRHGEPVQARAVGPLARHLRRWRRTWQAASLAALGLAVLGAALALQSRLLAAGARRRGAWERFYVLQGAAMERDLGLERALPAHDLEPAYGRLRTRLDQLGAQLAGQDRYAQGPGHFALAQGRCLLADWTGALRELDLAQARGFQGPETARLLARILAATQEQAGLADQFATGLEQPAPEADRIAALVRQGAEPETQPGPGAEALVAFLKGDCAQAAALARAASAARPWQDGAELLTVRSLAALARQAAAAGDPLLAEMRLDEARGLAQAGLARAPSFEAARHASLLAARGLASLHLDHLAPGALDRLQQAAEQALALNPRDPDLRDDRLFPAFLKARRMLDLGQDPGPVLDAALGTLAAWERDPLTPALRADRMLLHWLRAERAFRAGGDPGPDLRAALRDPGHTPFLGRDYLGDLQNFQARVAAARGEDPRPVLDQALAWMAPRLGPGAPCSLCGTAAQSWLIRGRWEAAHGLDPRPSLGRADALALRAQARRGGLR
jgi:serine/threonine-protein kinase